MINKLPSGLIQDVSSSEAFVVDKKKVCTLSTESFLALQQTFCYTNNGGGKCPSVSRKSAVDSDGGNYLFIFSVDIRFKYCNIENKKTTNIL